MKILLATSTFKPDIGGMATYAETIASWLSRSHDVTVVTYGPRSYKPENLSYNVIHIWRGIPKPFRQLIYLVILCIRALRADVIYALGTQGAGFPTAIASMLTRTPFVMRISGDRVWEGAMVAGKTELMIDEFQTEPKTSWTGYLWRLQSWVARKATHHIAHSHYLKRLLIGWGVDQKRITVIHSAVEEQETVLEKEQARKKLGIHGIVVFSAGRLVPWKGFATLITLMPELLKINPWFKLVIAGDGPEESRLKALIKRLKLEDNVLLVGRIDSTELLDYWAAADMFVLNTGYEGLSHMILEAMDASVPVITTNVGGNTEVIKQGMNGFLVKYNDRFNLVEAIKTVYQNEKIHRKFVRNGRRTIDEFSMENMCADAQAILEKTANG